MKTAKKAALGALAATVMAMVTPMTSASADPGDTLKGGCGFDTNQQETVTNGQNQGVIYVAAFSQEASGTPSTATVACWIDVNGVEQPGTRITKTDNGVIADSAQITFSSVDGDQINECQQVTFADGSTWTAADGNVGVDCPAADEFEVPPPVFFDVLNTVIDAVNGVLAQVDLNPVLCPLLQAIGPQNIGGVIIIEADGSLTITDPLGLIIVTNDCTP